jgi:hypothetical protein
MHRWVWDLHYSTPNVPHFEYPISAVPHDTPRTPLGPLALPGEYTVRLTANGHTYSAPLTVKMDPRVKTPPAGLEQQFSLEMRLASELTRSTDAVKEARSVFDQLQKFGSKPNGPAADSLKALQTKVGALLGKGGKPSGGPPQATLATESGNVGTLYGSIGQSDAAPTDAQIAAASDVERKLSPLLLQWETIKKSDLQKVNQQLHSAAIPELRLDSPTEPADVDKE